MGDPVSLLSLPPNRVNSISKMTIVCFIEDGGGIVGISDSSASSDDDVHVRKDSKMFKKSMGVGHSLVGFCGMFAVGQWFRFQDWPALPMPKAPAHIEEEEDYSYMVEKYLVTVLQPFLKKSLKKRFGKDDRGQVLAEYQDWTLLVGVPGGGIFTLYPNGDVGKAYDPDSKQAHACIGSGEHHAYTCISTLKKTRTDLRSWEMLQLGVEAAYKSVSSIRAPYDLKYIMY